DDLSVEERLDSWISQQYKQLLFLRGLKSSTAAARPLPRSEEALPRIEGPKKVAYSAPDADQIPEFPRSTALTLCRRFSLHGSNRKILATGRLPPSALDKVQEGPSAAKSGARRRATAPAGRPSGRAGIWRREASRSLFPGRAVASRPAAVG